MTLKLMTQWSSATLSNRNPCHCTSSILLFLRSIVKLPQILIFGLSALLGITSSAHACVCLPPSIEDQTSIADMIFEGEAILVDGARTTFRVFKKWKGRVGAEAEVFASEDDSLRSCFVYNFGLHKKYLVFALTSDRISHRYTDICTRTREIDTPEAKSDIDWLAKHLRVGSDYPSRDADAKTSMD